MEDIDPEPEARSKEEEVTKEMAVSREGFIRKLIIIMVTQIVFMLHMRVLNQSNQKQKPKISSSIRMINEII